MATGAQSERRRLMEYAEVPCRPGCSGCCKRYLVVSVAEAFIILSELVTSGKWKEAKKAAKEQLSAAKEAQPEAWFKMGIPCPVLDKESGTCTAWGVRPAACSTHFVQSDPELCDPAGHGHGRYIPLEFDDLYEEFKGKLAGFIPEGGIMSARFPMAIALLIAEAAATTAGSDLEEIVTSIARES